ncbi:MAG: DUF2950 domain-containing protein [Bryobacteraceae bacterium]
MKSRRSKFHMRESAVARFVAVAFCVFGLLLVAATQSKQPTLLGPEAFTTPQEAAQALIDAAEKYDVPALLKVLGPDAKDVVSSEDPVSDKGRSVAFAALAREKESVSTDTNSRVRATLIVGKDDWPFPIPIVNRKGSWHFDVSAGRQEILLRRIGANELDAIKICRGFVEAQEEYASKKHDGSQLNQYAQRIISTPSKHDGLAWQNHDGSWGGPVGEEVAKALAEGYRRSEPPFHGYYFRVLKGQGANAPLGQMNFIVGGAMIGGFALAAAPAQYRVTGVQTFVVSYEGVVYQKDLGPDTLKIFKGMELYNPDKTWQPTSDEQIVASDLISER